MPVEFQYLIFCDGIPNILSACFLHWCRIQAVLNFRKGDGTYEHCIVAKCVYLRANLLMISAALIGGPARHVRIQQVDVLWCQGQHSVSRNDRASSISGDGGMMGNLLIVSLAPACLNSSELYMYQGMLG